jgi:lipopolysaccharide/colanic/teichoic acid biosynthesis glycosyltransferase
MEMYEAIHLRSLQQTRRNRPKIYPAIKRVLEIILALVLLALLLPFFIGLAVSIRLSSPGPVLFRQKRVGKGGDTFTFYKFRSMYVDIDRDAHKAFMKAFVNGHAKDAGDNGHQDFKPIQTKQITKVGRFLRKTSLDELPQLFNIIKGDMSFIGPRPNMEAEVEEYKEWHKQRLDVLPGLTGLAQINGRSSLSFEQIVRYDLEYIENESLLLDLKVLWGTIPAVLNGKGAR